MTRVIFTAIFFLFSTTLLAADKQNLQLYFAQLNGLEFEKAKELAGLEPDQELSIEMLRLADIRFNAGQTEKPTLDSVSNEGRNVVLSVIRMLQKGYVSLFYDQVKGEAYREFYSAYQLAKSEDDPVLLKACLYAILDYHRAEVARDSEAYLTYLDHFESMSHDTIDQAWLTIYKSVFLSQTNYELDSNYFDLANDLDRHEKSLYAESPLLTHIFYEKALNFELRGIPEQAAVYYRKAVTQAKDYKFLWYVRFAGNIKLMILVARQNKIEEAQAFRTKAKAEVNLADTLRTNYFLNLYGAKLLNLANRNDSAYMLLNKALAQDFKLAFQTNTLEINRLNVELETREKENANLKLKQDKNWLAFGIGGVVLLAIVGYLVYRNQLSKSKIEIQQRAMHSIKLEKQLKEQEITGIDQMIEAQEKERQRIANELHDNLGSHLASIKLYFQNLQQKSNDPAQSDLLQKTDQLLEETYQQVRTMAHARTVGVNSKEGLMQAVRSFASKISGANNLSVDIKEHGMDTRLENSLEIMLFRIVQELTTNVIKHAKATEITISLTRHDESINLMVEDNGAGFDISQVKPGTMGLHSIQKRVETLGGRVAIDSIIGRGTTVIIDLPI